MSPTKLLQCFTALTLSAALSAAQTPPTSTKTINGNTTEIEYVNNKEFKTKFFFVQHRNPYALYETVKGLGSGAKGAVVNFTFQEGVKTITVRDFPENIAVIEEALKRLDVPPPTAKEVELHLYVFFASKQDGPSEGVPEELQDVLASLKSTLSYRSYAPAVSFVQRAASGSERIQGRGQTEMIVNAPKGESNLAPVGFDWAISQLSIETDREGKNALVLNKFEFCGWERVAGDLRDLAKLRTDLTLKDGEKVVVGTSAIKDKGLIVVLTAKVLK